jgi:hypothetical protein
MQMGFSYYQIEWQPGKLILLQLASYELGPIIKDVMIAFKILHLLNLLQKSV